MAKRIKKIEVEEDFLREVLKVQKEMQEEIRVLKEVKPQNTPLLPLQLNKVDTGLFWCVAVDTNHPDREKFNQDFKVCEKEIETIMRKYKIVSLQANIFNNL